MASVPQEFVTVEMRGLKTALVERSRADRVSVSSLVRAAVARHLGLADESHVDASLEPLQRLTDTPSVRLSIRVTRTEAQQFTGNARTAGLSQGAYLAGLIRRAPTPTTSAQRSDQIAALVTSSAELATLSRNIRHLIALLREGSVQKAQPYRAMFDTLTGDVRRHLALASEVLAEVRPPRGGGGATGRHSLP